MKRLFLVILLVISLVLSATITRYSWGDEGTGYTGTTTASYVEALQINSGKFDKVTITVENTGTDSTMYVQILIFPGSASTYDYALYSDASVAVSSSEIFEITQPVYGRIEVWVKNNSGETTYAIEYVGRK